MMHSGRHKRARRPPGMMHVSMMRQILFRTNEQGDSRSWMRVIQVRQVMRVMQEMQVMQVMQDVQVMQ